MFFSLISSISSENKEPKQLRSISWPQTSCFCSLCCLSLSIPAPDRNRDSTEGDCSLQPHLGPTLASTPSEVSHSKRQERIYDPLRRVFLILLERMVNPFPLGLRKKRRWDRTPGGSRAQVPKAGVPRRDARLPASMQGPPGAPSPLHPERPDWVALARCCSLGQTQHLTGFPVSANNFSSSTREKSCLYLHLHHLIFSYVM